MNWTDNKQDSYPEFRSGADPYRFNRTAKQVVDWLGAREQHPLFYNGRFYTYDGRRYVEVDDVTQLVRSFLKEQNLPQSNHLVGNVKPIVENFAAKSSREFGDMPFFLGKNGEFPDHKKIIAFRNGMLDLEAFGNDDHKLIPHTPKWISTFCLPYDFDPTADCPNWLAFLEDVFEDDQERAKILQEWFGYCLTADIKHHKALLKIGPPRAGKGTTDAVLRAVVGEDHTTGFNLHYLADKFGPRRLEGKLVAFVGEVNLANCRDKYRILETWNSILGGDPVAIERKNRDESPSAILPTRFSVSCNEMPSFVDPAGALASRLLILSYNKSNVGKEDRGLTDRLLKEVSGVTNWALEGYLRLERQGRFSTSKAMEKTVNSFRRESSHVFAFLQDCVQVQRTIDPGNLDGVALVNEAQEVDSQQLTAKYCLWCEENAVQPNAVGMARSLTSILPELEKRRRRKPSRFGDGKAQEWVTVYSGIGLA